MRLFHHHQANSLDQAIEFLKEHRGQVKPVSGGTDLLGGLKDDIHPVYPKWLLDLKKINELNRIEPTAGGLRVGALVKLAELENAPDVTFRFELLAQAAGSVASPQIRNMGTLAGNICQEPRCWYYRHPDNIFHCLRKGGKVCNAFIGDNRFHSIFGAVRVGRTACQSACPAFTNIPAYMSMLRGNNVAGAAEELLKVNPMPAITGRVCPHFCQEDCNRNMVYTPVAVRNVERFIGDYILDHTTDLMPHPSQETGKRVAVIGSGPSGLSTAYYLRLAGHSVTIFEQLDEPGGMLAYAIPDYRLPKEVVRRVVESIKAQGVEIKTGVKIGREIDFDDLRTDFQAVFIASGAWGKSEIGLTGEEYTLNGLDFLIAVKQGGGGQIGQKVVVIGGGNVAVDVAITSKRLGAASVTMVCLECREEIPANDQEIEQAKEEGVDIQTSWGPSRVVGSQGQVTGLELVRCTSVFDGECTFAPTFDETCNKSIDADQVILATGQKTDFLYLKDRKSPRFENGHIWINKQTQITSMPDVFTGGDAATGPATVIDAIASGRRAARSINLLLGSKESFQGEVPANNLVDFSMNSLTLGSSASVSMIKVESRNLTDEDAAGIQSDAVSQEAARCFNCGCVAASPSDIAPVLIALDAVVETTGREVPAENFFSTEIMGSTILKSDELITGVYFPDPGPDTGQAYLKFRLRNAIDFPVLGVAVLLQFYQGKVSKARIVFSAAAPIPLRAPAAEDFLVDNVINEQTALKAGQLSVDSAISLSGNKHKIKIAQTLVARALLQAARNFN